METKESWSRAGEAEARLRWDPAGVGELSPGWSGRPDEYAQDHFQAHPRTNFAFTPGT